MAARLGRAQGAQDGSAVAVEGVAQCAEADNDLCSPDDGRGIVRRGLMVERPVSKAQGALKEVRGDEQDGDVPELRGGAELAERVVLELHLRFWPAASFCFGA